MVLNRMLLFMLLVGAGGLGAACSIDTFPTPKPTPCQTNADCAGSQVCQGSICAGLQGAVSPPAARTTPPVSQGKGCNTAGLSWVWKNYGGDVRGLAFGPNQELVSAVGVEPGVSKPTPGELRIHGYTDYHSQKKITGFQGGVHKLAFSPDGKFFASASVSGEVIIWDAATHQQHKVLQAHTAEVVGLAFSPDGRYLATGGYKGDSSIRIWSTSTWQTVHHLTKPLIGYSLSLVFSPDSSKLFSGGYEAQVWDVSAGTLVSSPKVTGDPTLSVDWHPGGQLLVYGQPDGTLILADAATGKATASWQAHADRVSAVIFSRDGQNVISAGLDGKIYIWDTTTHQKVFTVSDPTQGEHKGAVHSLAIHPNGHVFASGGADGTVRTWKCGVKP